MEDVQKNETNEQLENIPMAECGVGMSFRNKMKVLQEMELESEENTETN